MTRQLSAEFVIKLSKYCNLRCSYCYEFNELGNKQRMSLDLIAQMFDNIARHAVATGLDQINFVWHGGEPFLVPLEYYELIGRLQHETFGVKVAVSNVAQTNLTVMTERHVEFLKCKKFFRNIGISFDVHGDQRVDKQGQLQTGVVLHNMQKLIDNQISFGAIAVLARNTLPHVRQIYGFYDRLRISSRFLPFYMSASDDQIADHSITYAELVTAFTALFDEWMASEHATPVTPISDYINYAVAHIGERRASSFNKETDECVFIVNLDGGVWGQSEAYEPEYQYGNLARESFAAILTSKGRRLAIEQAESRTERYCGACPYYGACPGHFVGDSSPQQQQMIEQSGCPVKEVLDHIVGSLEKNGLSERIENLTKSDPSKAGSDSSHVL